MQNSVEGKKGKILKQNQQQQHKVAEAASRKKMFIFEYSSSSFLFLLLTSPSRLYQQAVKLCDYFALPFLAFFFSP